MFNSEIIWSCFSCSAEEPEMLSAGEMAPSAEGWLSLNETLKTVSLSAGRFFVCPAGWERYRSSCYLYVSPGRSWSGAAVNLILYSKIHQDSQISVFKFITFVCVCCVSFRPIAIVLEPPWLLSMICLSTVSCSSWPVGEEAPWPGWADFTSRYPPPIYPSNCLPHMIHLHSSASWR